MAAGAGSAHRSVVTSAACRTTQPWSQAEQHCLTVAGTHGHFSSSGQSVDGHHSRQAAAVVLTLATCSTVELRRSVSSGIDSWDIVSSVNHVCVVLERDNVLCVEWQRPECAASTMAQHCTSFVDVHKPVITVHGVTTGCSFVLLAQSQAPFESNSTVGSLCYLHSLPSCAGLNIQPTLGPWWLACRRRLTHSSTAADCGHRQLRQCCRRSSLRCCCRLAQRIGMFTIYDMPQNCSSSTVA